MDNLFNCNWPEPPVVTVLFWLSVHLSHLCCHLWPIAKKLGQTSAALEGMSEAEGQRGAQPPPPVFGKSVNLSQPERTDYAHNITTRLPDFQTFRHPCIESTIIAIDNRQKCNLSL